MESMSYGFGMDVAYHSLWKLNGLTLTHQWSKSQPEPFWCNLMDVMPIAQTHAIGTTSGFLGPAIAWWSVEHLKYSKSKLGFITRTNSNSNNFGTGFAYIISESN